RCDGLAGEIVRRGTQTARCDHEVRPLEALPEGVADDFEPIRHRGDAADEHAAAYEVLREIARVRVARVADGELGADGEHLRRLDWPRAGGPHDQTLSRGGLFGAHRRRIASRESPANGPIPARGLPGGHCYDRILS